MGLGRGSSVSWRTRQRQAHRQDSATGEKRCNGHVQWSILRVFRVVFSRNRSSNCGLVDLSMGVGQSPANVHSAERTLGASPPSTFAHSPAGYSAPRFSV